MAYFIQGEHYPVIFLANVRTASTATAEALMENGAYQQGKHHDDMGEIPEDALVVHTYRHHCDVILSYWYHRASGHTLEAFVELVLSGKHDLLSADGFYNHWKVKPNFPLKYENLEYEFANLCVCAGLPDIELPVGKNTRRPPDTKWQDVFPHPLRLRVEKHFEEELEELGYRSD